MGLPSFEEVVAEHGAYVLRVCRAVLDGHDAEDAWSETFLAALAAYPNLRPDSNVRGWLATIAHRKAIDRIRLTARSPVPTERLPEQPTAGGPSEPDTALWAAVAALPPKQRGAVTYHYVADLSYAEVAGLIGTTEPAARRNAADGIAALRRSLSEEARS